MLCNFLLKYLTEEFRQKIMSLYLKSLFSGHLGHLLWLPGKMKLLYVPSFQ